MIFYNKFNRSLKLMSIGVISGMALLMLGGCGHADVKETVAEVTGEEKTEAVETALEAETEFSDMDTIAETAVGEYVTFGRYEQDNNPDNGAEPIEWMVLAHQDGRTLLLSRYGLDSAWYHAENVTVTWENCNLRSWLNTQFYYAAFNDAEKSQIVRITNENADGNKFWESIGRESDPSVTGGNDTQDNVFLLSLYEAQEYLGVSGEDNKAAGCKPTEYAKAQGVYVLGGLSWWWLRTPGMDICSAAVINDYGRATADFVYHEYKAPYAVRPAIWVGKGERGKATELAEYVEPGEKNTQASGNGNANELSTDGYSGLYSGSVQGKYYYVWLQEGTFTSVTSPVGTIRLLFEGNEPYTEGNALAQDESRNIYMGDVDDVYMITPGWNGENSSILTIDQDEFGKYSGKIFCFGVWLNKDTSLVYDGNTLKNK